MTDKPTYKAGDWIVWLGWSRMLANTNVGQALTDSGPSGFINVELNGNPVTLAESVIRHVTPEEYANLVGTVPNG